MFEFTFYLIQAVIGRGCEECYPWVSREHVYKPALGARTVQQQKHRRLWCNPRWAAFEGSAGVLTYNMIDVRRSPDDKYACLYPQL